MSPGPAAGCFRGLRSGLSVLLFFMGIAAAFSGAVLYAYYESRQEQTVSKVDDFVGGFSDQLDSAKKAVQAEGDTAKQDIRNQLDELQKFAASGSTLTGLLDKARPSVWFVSTLDQAGAPSVGSAFVVFSDNQTSFLLASYTTIQAATQQPGPGVTLRKQGEPDLQATVFTWDPAHDLALLTVPRPSLPALPWASGDPPSEDRRPCVRHLRSRVDRRGDHARIRRRRVRRRIATRHAGRHAVPRWTAARTPTVTSWPSRPAPTHHSGSNPTPCSSRRSSACRATACVDVSKRQSRNRAADLEVAARPSVADRGGRRTAVVVVEVVLVDVVGAVASGGDVVHVWSLARDASIGYRRCPGSKPLPSVELGHVGGGLDRRRLVEVSHRHAFERALHVLLPRRGGDRPTGDLAHAVHVVHAAVRVPRRSAGVPSTPRSTTSA